MTIEVTNVEEPGTVMLSTLQPQVGVAVTATLTDPDTIDGTGHCHLAVVQGQQPHHERERRRRHDQCPLTFPSAGDVGSKLRATAMYDDGEGDDKTAREDSYRSIRSAPATNIAPTFPDQDLSTVTLMNQTADQGSGREHACGQEYWRSRCSQ